MDKETLRELLRITVADMKETVSTMDEDDLDRLKRRFESLIADIEEYKEEM